MPKWPRMLGWRRRGCSWGCCATRSPRYPTSSKRRDSDVHRRTEHGHHRRVRRAAVLRRQFYEAHRLLDGLYRRFPKRSMLHTLGGRPGEECILLLGPVDNGSAGRSATSIQYATRPRCRYASSVSGQRPTGQACHPTQQLVGAARGRNPQQGSIFQGVEPNAASALTSQLRRPPTSHAGTPCSPRVSPATGSTSSFPARSRSATGRRTARRLLHPGPVRHGR